MSTSPSPHAVRIIDEIKKMTNKRLTTPQDAIKYFETWPEILQGRMSSEDHNNKKQAILDYLYEEYEIPEAERRDISAW